MSRAWTPTSLARVTEASWWDRALGLSDDVAGHARNDEAGHAVYLHDGDDDLLDRLEAYVVDGWAHGQRTILFAEAARIGALRDRLAARGLEQAIDPHDADEALEVFLRGGMPQAPLFTAMVNETLAQQGHGSVRLYGEMVAVLWRDGAITAALELERLWNAYLAAHPLPLLCAYPAADLAGHPDQGRICRTHAHVFPAA